MRKPTGRSTKRKFIFKKLAKEQEHRKEFNKVTSDLHHLVSTATIPGVYNKRQEVHATIYNADIETHLKSQSRLLTRKKIAAVYNRFEKSTGLD